MTVSLLRGRGRDAERREKVKKRKPTLLAPCSNSFQGPFSWFESNRLICSNSASRSSSLTPLPLSFRRLFSASAPLSLEISHRGLSTRNGKPMHMSTGMTNCSPTGIIQLASLWILLVPALTPEPTIWPSAISRCICAISIPLS